MPTTLASPPTFAGFPPDAFRFLAGLSAHNEKAWFDEHRTIYDDSLIAPARAFVDLVGPRLQEFAPDVRFEPRVNGSIMRINRDVRFAKDKSPYKTHLDLWFWRGPQRGWDAPGFFLRMHSDRLTLGAGMHGFEKAMLDAYRRAVVDDASGVELAQLVAAVTSDGKYSVGGGTRKTVPRGYDAAHPRANLLMFEGLFAFLECPLPAESGSAKFVAYCEKHYRCLSPIADWISTHVRVT